jgi:hypothetical protein
VRVRATAAIHYLVDEWMWIYPGSWVAGDPGNPGESHYKYPDSNRYSGTLSG